MVVCGAVHGGKTNILVIQGARPTCRRRVVFPAPLCPTRSTVSPRFPLHCSRRAARMGKSMNHTLSHWMSMSWEMCAINLVLVQEQAL